MVRVKALFDFEGNAAKGQLPMRAGEEVGTGGSACVSWGAAGGSGSAGVTAFLCGSLVSRAAGRGHPKARKCAAQGTLSPQFELLSDTKSWWSVRASSGQQGVVPSNFLERMADGVRSVVPPQGLEAQPWFFGDISRADSEALLAKWVVCL